MEESTSSSPSSISHWLFRVRMLGRVCRPLARTPVVLPAPIIADWQRVWRWVAMLPWLFLTWFLPAFFLPPGSGSNRVQVFRSPGRPRRRFETRCTCFTAGWVLD